MRRQSHQNTFEKFFRDIFTGRDNRTYDMGRVLWFQSIQAFILVTIYALHKGGSFDPVTWGAGLAALITGGGAAIGLKSNTEPHVGYGDPPPPDYLDSVTSARTRASQVSVNVAATTTTAPAPAPLPPDDPDA